MPSASPARTGAVILVVEDDAEIRDLLREVLEEEGFVVAAAEHGKEALDALEAGVQPALILVDLMMPVMNGWELLDALRERFPTIPVTVVSAVADRVPPVNVPVIRKPINLDVLIDAVNHVIRP